MAAIENDNLDKVLILGVTASGKGRLGFELAKKLGGEVLSVDSMKVYKRMDTGTAKPPMQRRLQVRHHLIDVVEPWESFSVDRFLELSEQAISDIRGRGKRVIAVGGTAMYIKAMLYGIFEGPGTDEQLREKLQIQVREQGGPAGLHRRLAEVDPEAAGRIHPNDEKRIVRALEVYELTGRPISSFQTQFEAEKPKPGWWVLGLRREKTDASSRINQRVIKMVEQGLVDEVRSLLADERGLSKQAAQAIGYAEIIEHLQGRMELDKAIEKIKINTRRLAKGQRTWFKTFREVQWIDVEPDESVESVLKRAVDLCAK